jgi:hypothetical protein
MASFDIKPQDLLAEVDYAKKDVTCSNHIEVDNAASTKELNNLPFAFTANEERICLREIDTWVATLIIVTYGLQYIDKVILKGLHSSVLCKTSIYTPSWVTMNKPRNQS